MHEGYFFVFSSHIQDALYTDDLSKYAIARLMMNQLTEQILHIKCKYNKKE